MALLPFLGAGYTHKQGEFQDVVQRGLDYLKQRGMRISYGNDLRDGSSIYGHALATIALCEAYGMTGDKELKEAAQGGWITSLTSRPQDGRLALQSGRAGRYDRHRLDADGAEERPDGAAERPVAGIFSAQRFLDSVQNKDGSQYGYLSRKPRPATTAVGLLCRMYTGWRRTIRGWSRAIAELDAKGPSKDNIYFDYYATQVLFHYAGPEWDPWNRKMREYLISSQEREGHPAGSWYFESQQSAAGGRLYNTAMAAMILEVYYRFMPLYGEEAVVGGLTMEVPIHLCSR